MTGESITIEIDPEAAKAYRSASAENQKKMQVLLSLWLRDLATADPTRLKKIMTEIGRKAQERGLTPEILASLLEET
jgi:hypothetical protein